MELGLVLLFVSSTRGVATLTSALDSCDNARLCQAARWAPALRVVYLLGRVRLPGNATWRWIYPVLDILHNGNGLHGPVGL